jgi:hypothetical protein
MPYLTRERKKEFRLILRLGMATTSFSYLEHFRTSIKQFLCTCLLFRDGHHFFFRRLRLRSGFALVENRPNVAGYKSLLSRAVSQDNGGATKGPIFCPGSLTTHDKRFTTWQSRGAQGTPLLSRVVTQPATKDSLRDARRTLLL